jgi:hypothetical protein
MNTTYRTLQQMAADLHLVPRRLRQAIRDFASRCDRGHQKTADLRRLFPVSSRSLAAHRAVDQRYCPQQHSSALQIGAI